MPLTNTILNNMIRFIKFDIDLILFSGSENELLNLAPIFICQIKHFSEQTGHISPLHIGLGLGDY